MSGYTIRKVSELAAEYGEEFVNNVTNSFSCRFNDEVDDFLKRNSLDFARRKVSVTELVFDNESKLETFYGNCGFNKFAVRDTTENGKPITYDQLFLFLK